MILLAVDIGNTNICYSLNDGKAWLPLNRIKTHSSDWYESLRKNISELTFDDCVISSVVPSHTHAVFDCIRSIMGKDPLLVKLDINTGLKSIPQELGTDLLCNAVEAHATYPDEYVTVADFGTAFTTITVSPKGEVSGVTICPGLLTSLKALFENTSQIPQVRLDLPKTILGRDTISSVRGGVIYGFVGQLESIVRQIEKELGHKVKLIATGGFSVYIAPYVEKVDIVDVNITINGLKRIFELNR